MSHLISKLILAYIQYLQSQLRMIEPGYLPPGDQDPGYTLGVDLAQQLPNYNRGDPHAMVKEDHTIV